MGKTTTTHFKAVQSVRENAPGWKVIFPRHCFRQAANEHGSGRMSRVAIPKRIKSIIDTRITLDKRTETGSILAWLKNGFDPKDFDDLPSNQDNLIGKLPL